MSAESLDPEIPVDFKTVKALTMLSLKRTFDLFAGNHGESLPLDEASQRLKIACKVRAEYASTQHFTPAAATGTGKLGATTTAVGGGGAANGGFVPPSTSGDAPAAPSPSPRAPESKSSISKMIDSIQFPPAAEGGGGSTALVVHQPQKSQQVMEVLREKPLTSASVSKRLASKWPRPVWHPPWKCYRVISGHLGWVRSIAFDPSNEWFCTGSADRTIKIWDVATGQLRLTLTGHIEQVTGLAVSPRHPYMFSCGLDKTVKCWDMEQNKVIRNYHGHLSGVYCLCVHPTLDVLMSGGRDSVCRVWDMRSKVQIHCLAGHENTVGCVASQAADPQVLTGSHDTTIKLWDLRKGRTMSTLTYHKKSVRAMAMHPVEDAFASGSAENIKKFKLPQGEFLHNMLQQQRAIINTMSVNEDNVLVTGGDNGSLWFWDWTSGNVFQQHDSIVQPGSLDAEAGIFASSFDVTGSRFVTCEADKTIKMWKEDDKATPETHPVMFRPPKDFKRF